MMKAGGDRTMPKTAGHSKKPIRTFAIRISNDMVELRRARSLKGIRARVTKLVRVPGRKRRIKIVLEDMLWRGGRIVGYVSYPTFCARNLVRMEVNGPPVEVRFETFKGAMWPSV